MLSQNINDRKKTGQIQRETETDIERENEGRGGLGWGGREAEEETLVTSTKKQKAEPSDEPGLRHVTTLKSIWKRHSQNKDRRMKESKRNPRVPEGKVTKEIRKNC